MNQIGRIKVIKLIQAKMSQFIFDEIYGSQAKKRKIMQSSNFLYYRQMMKIKNKHISNPSLYAQLYTIPTYEEPSITVKLQKKYPPNFFSALNQNNYVIQKINPHAFKIVKRKQKLSNNAKFKEINPLNMTIHRGLSIHSERKLSPRRIDEDAKRIRSYLESSPQKSPIKPKTALKNHSMDLETNRTFRTYSRQKNSERDRSLFSSLDIKRY